MGDVEFVTNCPNCGAPLDSYGRCAYCGTTTNRAQRVDLIQVRPGMRKLKAQAMYPLELGVDSPQAVVKYAARNIRDQIADALTDCIKFVVKKDFDYERFEEVIVVRGELFVADSDVRW